MDHLHHDEFRWRTLSKYVTWQLSVVSRALLHGDRAIKCVIHKLMVRRRTAQWRAYDVMSWRWNAENNWNSHSRVWVSQPRFRPETFRIYCLLLLNRLFWAGWNTEARLVRGHRKPETVITGDMRKTAGHSVQEYMQQATNNIDVVIQKRKSKCQLF